MLTVTRGEDVSKGGAVFLNDEMDLVDLREKPKPGEPTSPWYNAGLYAFRPSIFDFTAKLKPSPRGEYELTDAIRDLAQSGKKVKALELTGEWADVRDPEILAKLNQAVVGQALRLPHGAWQPKRLPYNLFTATGFFASSTSFSKRGSPRNGSQNGCRR